MKKSGILYYVLLFATMLACVAALSAGIYEMSAPSIVLATQELAIRLFAKNILTVLLPYWKYLVFAALIVTMAYAQMKFLQQMTKNNTAEPVPSSKEY